VVAAGGRVDLRRLTADSNTALVEFSDRGFSGQTLGKKALGGTTLAVTQIFSDTDAVIVTIAVDTGFKYLSVSPYAELA